MSVFRFYTSGVLTEVKNDLVYLPMGSLRTNRKQAGVREIPENKCRVVKDYDHSKVLFMITVIAGTNRKGSAAGKLASRYAALLKEQTAEEVRLLLLEEEAQDWVHPQMYQEQSESLRRIQDTYMLPAAKFVFVIPEYNGSYPGYLKLFLDACSVRDIKGTFRGKKAALLGVASGRAGNLRGMDHLSGVLHYLGVWVLPSLQPVSRIGDLMDASGSITHDETIAILTRQAADLAQI